MNPTCPARDKPGSPDLLTGKAILYVDDDKDWRDVVSVTFKDAGYKVLAAKDATEAMVLAESATLSLIILDLDLDGEDGVILMKFFKCNQPDVPIILFTGLSHDDEAILELLRQGANQYIRKGPLEDLRKAVQAAVR